MDLKIINLINKGQELQIKGDKLVFENIVIFKIIIFKKIENDK